MTTDNTHAIAVICHILFIQDDLLNDIKASATVNCDYVYEKFTTAVRNYIKTAKGLKELYAEARVHYQLTKKQDFVHYPTALRDYVLRVFDDGEWANKVLDMIAEHN